MYTNHVSLNQATKNSIFLIENHRIKTSIIIFQNSIDMAVSRLVAYQEIKRNWLKHEDRLIHIKSTLNTRQPTSKIPTTRKQNIHHSLQVQLENKALLKKLTDRMHLRDDSSMVCQSANPLPRSNRKRYYEEHRIKCENQGLYRRLKQTRPMIDLNTMRLQRAETEKLLNTISKFGYKNLKPTKTVMKFDLSNNQLKYLSRRKILIDQKMKEKQLQGNSGELRQDRVIELQLAKHRKTEKLFHYFSRFRQINVDNHETVIKITRGSLSIIIELSAASNKENNEGDLQVNISKELFKEKYHQDLEELVNKLRYDQKTKTFYIL